MFDDYVDTFLILLPYWPVLLWTVIVSVLAQTLKIQILTEALSKKNVVAFWLRRTLPILLLLLGVLVGLLWPGEAFPGVLRPEQKALAFAGGSGLAIVGFNVFRQWRKEKSERNSE